MKDILPDKITLGAAAALLRLYPRTILRHMTGEKDPYYNPMICDGDEIEVARLCDVYSMKESVFEEIRRGRDEVILTREIPDNITGRNRVTGRMIRIRKYPKLIDRGALARYSRREVILHHIKTVLSNRDFEISD